MKKKTRSIIVLQTAIAVMLLTVSIVNADEALRISESDSVVLNDISETALFYQFDFNALSVDVDLEDTSVLRCAFVVYQYGNVILTEELRISPQSMRPAVQFLPHNTELLTAMYEMDEIEIEISIDNRIVDRLSFEDLVEFTHAWQEEQFLQTALSEIVFDADAHHVVDFERSDRSMEKSGGNAQCTADYILCRADCADLHCPPYNPNCNQACHSACTNVYIDCLCLTYDVIEDGTPDCTTHYDVIRDCFNSQSCRNFNPNFVARYSLDERVCETPVIRKTYDCNDQLLSQEIIRTDVTTDIVASHFLYCCIPGTLGCCQAFN